MAKVATWQQLARVFAGRNGEVRAAWRLGTTEATRRLWVQCHANMQALIYAHPPDQNKRGFYQTRKGVKTYKRITPGARAAMKKPGRRGGEGFKWTQTGNLLAAERMSVLDDYTGLLRNSAVYAHARHNLAAKGQDIIPPPPTKKRKSWRVAPWRARAIRETREQRLEAYRVHLVAALQRQGV